MAAVAGACGGGGSSTPDATPADAAPPEVTLGVPCADTTDGVYGALPTLPAFDPSHRGDVFRCARDRWLDAATLDAAARGAGYVGPTLTSGATIFRIAFRTERATEGDAVVEGHSTGFLLVPDAPRADAALVVYAHPSVGIAPSCAPSRIDLGASGDGWEPMRGPVLAMVGAGLPVIAPDYAGFSFGEAPAWASAPDEAMSVLDATRAATQLLPAASRPAKVVIVGHSIGGHAALAAHGMAASYGHDGELIGVLTLAPFWVSNLAWGAAISPAVNLNTSTSSYLLEYDLDYFYGHGELLDGPGHGTDLIKPEKRDQVRTLLTTQCVTPVAMGMKDLGTTPADYFDANAVDALGNCGLTGTCDKDPAPKWKARFLADRPAIDTAGAPIVMWFGGKDTTVTPGFAECAIEKLAADMGTTGTTAITTCADPDGEHITVPGRQIAWVNDWIAARVAGSTLPTCTAPKTPSEGGATCPTIPPNTP